MGHRMGGLTHLPRFICTHLSPYALWVSPKQHARQAGLEGSSQGHLVLLWYLYIYRKHLSKLKISWETGM